MVCSYVGRYALESKKGEERGEIHLQVCYLPVSVDMTPEREEFTYPLHTMIRNNRFETFERIIQHSTCASEQTNKSSIERARACGCAAASRYSSSVWTRERSILTRSLGRRHIQSRTPRATSTASPPSRSRGRRRIGSSLARDCCVEGGTRQRGIIGASWDRASH